MKRAFFFLSAIGALALGGAAAHAADLGVQRYAPPPPPPPPVYTWTGFYIGGNGGFGGDEFKYPFSVGPGLLGAGPITGNTQLNSSGGFGGGQIGYNWQVAPFWVIGVEADFEGADIEGKIRASASIPAFAGVPAMTDSASAGSTLNWFGTVRGRVGYLVTNNALLYATGGWAYGRTTSEVSVGTPFFSTSNSFGVDHNDGWTAGAGLEYAFNPWLTFKTEYLHIDLGTKNLASTIGPAAVPFSISEKTTIDTVKAGVNVKFSSWGWPW